MKGVAAFVVAGTGALAALDEAMDMRLAATPFGAIWRPAPACCCILYYRPHHHRYRDDKQARRVS